MELRQLPSRISDSSLEVSEFSQYAAGWLFDCEIRQLSPRVIDLRKLIIEKFVWFLKYKEIPLVNATSIRQFMAYVGKGHESAEGRWGNPKLKKEPTAATVQLYHRHLRALCNWIVSEERLAVSPMAKIKPPIDRADQIKPFNDEQLHRILAAARKSTHPRRNEAICLFLLDTGIRVSELCALRYKDIELSPASRGATVLGKGRKKRTVPFGSVCAKALWQYLREEDRNSDSPVFMADKGLNAGEAMTRNAVLLMMRRLGRAAGIQGVRMSPHTFRHTFAISFLRSGGNQFTLMQLLGHTDLKMTSKYVAIAEADMENQHRLHSPADRLKRKSR